MDVIIRTNLICVLFGLPFLLHLSISLFFMLVV